MNTPDGSLKYRGANSVRYKGKVVIITGGIPGGAELGYGRKARMSDML